MFMGISLVVRHTRAITAVGQLLFAACELYCLGDGNRRRVLYSVNYPHNPGWRDIDCVEVK